MPIALRASLRASAIAVLMAAATAPAQAANIVIDSFVTPFDVTAEAGWNSTFGTYVGPRSAVTMLTQTGIAGAIGDRTTTFTGDNSGNGAAIASGFTIDTSGTAVASPGEGVLTLNTNAGSLAYGFEMSWDVSNVDLSAGDRFVFNLSGDLDAPRNPVAFLPFDIELTSGATTDTAGVIVSADGAYQILFSSFSGIDFSDIDGIKLLSTNSGVLSPDLALSALEVQVVPVPAAVWMFGSALGLLGWVRRRSAIL